MPHIYFGISIGWKGGFFGDNVTVCVTRMGEESFRTNNRNYTKLVEKNPQSKTSMYGWDLYLVKKLNQKSLDKMLGE